MYLNMISLFINIILVSSMFYSFIKAIKNIIKNFNYKNLIYLEKIDFLLYLGSYSFLIFKMSFNLNNIKKIFSYILLIIILFILMRMLKIKILILIFFLLMFYFCLFFYYLKKNFNNKSINKIIIKMKQKYKLIKKNYIILNIKNIFKKYLNFNL